MERWKPVPVPEFADLYEVSSRGRFRRIEHVRFSKHWGNRIIPMKILKTSKRKRGYMVIGFCRNSKKKTFDVHPLVAKAFVPNPLNLPEVNHKDLDKTNNVAWNLEWSTRKKNCAHAKANGRYANVYQNFGFPIGFEGMIDSIRK